MPLKNRSRHFALSAWLLLLLSQLSMSTGLAQTNTPAKIEGLAFNNMEAFQVFQVYRQLSGLELDISTGAMSQSKRVLTVSSQTALTKAEMQKLLENALRDQTGLIITRIDNKKSSVTFDAALPIKPVKPSPPPAKVIRTNTPPSSPPSLLPPPPADKKQ